MKLGPDFDDELQPKGQRRSLSVCAIGQLLLLAVVCAVVMSVISIRAGTGTKKGNVRFLPAMAQRPAQIPQVQAAEPRPRDPFVVIAAVEVDARMVVPAPADIDEAMVFNPDNRERRSALRGPALGSPLMASPVTPPGQLPEGYLPQLPAPAQPH